ncbi:amidase signature domain-containing protein [Phaeosphaeriaceae sp. PMI808]|nr:amidase signature domain-containing protein [Phaeosphaeriaceae sp. PMI808]
MVIRDSGITEGSYFVRSGQLAQAWRLYPDETDSFQLAVLPEYSTNSNDFRFKVLNSMSEDGLAKSVAVPSRLYAKPTKEKPLSGVRISIKDNIRLKGVRTSNENRSFLETYGDDEENAVYVQKLLQLGAVIVGKTKLGAFASAEDPPLQWIDYPCSWSVRGDGYQQPLGSTTGGVTAIIAYSWLDVSVGTDTTGSIRAPAAHNGAWGIRTSTELATHFQGIYPFCSQFDTVGLLSRPAENLKHFPKRVLWNTDFWDRKPHTEPYEAIVDSFVKVLESFLGITTVKFSMRECWIKCRPIEAEGQSLEEYLEKTIYAQGLYESYWHYEDFRNYYREKFKKPPYVTPYLAGKWEAGRAITVEEKNASIKSMHVFRQWFRDNIIKSDPETASDAVMLLPQGSGKPFYRDQPVEVPFHGNGYQAITMAVLIAGPQVILPIGQVPYHSRITDRTEYLPVAATIAGTRGSDLMLINLAQAALRSASWPTEVETGSLTFKLGHENADRDEVRNAQLLRTPEVSPKIDEFDEFAAISWMFACQKYRVFILLQGQIHRVQLYVGECVMLDGLIANLMATLAW